MKTRKKRSAEDLESIVYGAVVLLLLDGIKPTLKAVINLIGGSRRDIAPALRKARALIDEELKASGDHPEDRLVKKLFYGKGG